MLDKEGEELCLLYLGSLFKRHFSVSSLKGEQIEAAVHLLRSKDVAAILQTGIEV